MAGHSRLQGGVDLKSQHPVPPLTPQVLRAIPPSANDRDRGSGYADEGSAIQGRSS
jgi:hypothetical protein